jgi:hypothetical protein
MGSMSARRFVVGLCAVLSMSLAMSASAFASAPETPGPVKVASIEAYSAMLSGVLNPNAAGEAGTYEFLYKASASECQGASTQRGLTFGFTGEEVAQEIQGLSANTEYSVCLLARTLGGETAVGSITTFKTALPPETPVTEEATSVTAGSAVLHGTLNPSSPGEAGSYHFLYAISASKCQGESVSSTASAAGHEQETVSSEVTGLLPNTTYTFCASAANSAEESVVGGPVTFTTPSSPPSLSNVSAQNSGVQETTLTATLNPGGAATSYRVEYGPTIPYTSNSPEQSLYSTTPIQLQVHLTNLTPGERYHYRFTASNSLGTTQSADYIFNTTSEASSSTLPDKRIYELVTPPENNFGSEVYQPEESEIQAHFANTQTEFPFQAAANGERIAFVGGPTEGGSESSGHHGGNEYLATRQPGGGWKQANVTPEAPSAVYQAFSSNLSVGYLDATEPLSPTAPGFGETPEFAGDYDVLYSTSLGSNEFDPAFDVKPSFRSMSTFQTAADARAPESVRRPAFNGGTSGNRAYDDRVLIFAGASADSSHILFMANDALTGATEGRPAAEGGSGGAFAEENNLYESVDGHLRLVNVLPDGTTHAGALFGDGPLFNHVISADGSRIFWTDLNTGHLYVRENGTATVEISSAGKYQTATADGSKVFYTNGDLYEYELAGAQTTDLTPGVPVKKVVGASENGEYVYFVTDADELEVWHDGVSVPIATSSVFLGEVTPDGHSIVFVDGPIYINKSVHVYDVDTGRLYCASCSSDGTTGGLQSTNGWGVYQPRWISSDGSRVFFDSREGLVPQDTNGRLDVYEWQRPGSAGCELSEGCVYLLSGGTSEEESYFLDASESGDGVFLATRAQLVNGDDNQLFDLYDVRVDGSAPLAPPVCTGSGCQGVPGAPPIFATPSSVTFEGVGNFTTPVKEAAKPKVKPKPKKKTKKKGKHKKSARKKKSAKGSGKSKAKKSAYKTKRQKPSGAKGGRS